MPSYRPERVAAMIHRELAERLRLEIKDPRIADVTITSVNVSKDLSRATVSYLPLGGDLGADPASVKERARVLQEGLEDASRRLRGPIGRALRLRHAPELVFAYDVRAEQAFAVTRLIDRIAADRRGREPEDGEE